MKAPVSWICTSRIVSSLSGIKYEIPERLSGRKNTPEINGKKQTQNIKTVILFLTKYYCQQFVCTSVDN